MIDPECGKDLEKIKLINCPNRNRPCPCGDKQRFKKCCEYTYI